MLPLAFPSLLAGAAMSWARALGEFGATITFAGNMPGVTQTMPLAVYLALQTDLDAAVAMSVLLLAVSVGVLLGIRLVTPRLLPRRAPCSISWLGSRRGEFELDARAPGQRRLRPRSSWGRAVPARPRSCAWPRGSTGSVTGRIVLDGEVYADTAADIHVPPWRRSVGLRLPGLRTLSASERGGERGVRASRGRRAERRDPARVARVLELHRHRGAGSPQALDPLRRPAAARRARAGPGARSAPAAARRAARRPRPADPAAGAGRAAPSAPGAA